MRAAGLPAVYWAQERGRWVEKASGVTTWSDPWSISAPEPRTLDLIFTPEARARLEAGYELLEADAAAVGELDAGLLARARYIIGQPPLSRETVEAMPALRCVFNVESNLLDNMPYDLLFARGIHTVTTGAVFAEPVAELGLGAGARPRARASPTPTSRSARGANSGAATATRRRG